MDSELNNAINDVMAGYKGELIGILNNDLDFLARLDEMFLISIFDDQPQEISSDFIDGFCSALWLSGKIKDQRDSLRLSEIIKSARTLISLG